MVMFLKRSCKLMFKFDVNSRNIEVINIQLLTYVEVDKESANMIKFTVYSNTARP